MADGVWLTGSRQDTWLTHFQIDNWFLGAWDQFSGGEIDSEEAKYRPGGMDYEISLGGRVTYGNVTVAKYWENWLSQSLYPWAIGRVGKARIYICRYPMTADFVQIGRGVAYQGTLKRISVPDYDSMGTDVALMEAECTIDRTWA